MTKVSLWRENTLNLDEISTFVYVALEYLEHSIEANKKQITYTHAYNLMTIEGNDAISNLIYQKC